MNPRTRSSLERMVDQLERSQRRSSRRITPASLALVAGLFLGFFLLTRVIPSIWPALLGGDPGQMLRGWSLLVWKTAMVAARYDTVILAGLAVASLIVLTLTYRVGLLRPVVWLAALGVVVIDAGLLASTILACIEAASQVV
ncbi:MAG: hypothetical protein U0794_13935 [Isosphaeraceae bacterium]